MPNDKKTELISLVSALVGALFGGLVVITSTVLQGLISDERDFNRIKRDKLEMVLTHIDNMENCMQLYIRDNKSSEECLNQYKATTVTNLALLYFPELEIQIGSYSKDYYNSVMEIEKCKNNTEKKRGKRSEEYWKCSLTILSSHSDKVAWINKVARNIALNTRLTN